VLVRRKTHASSGRFRDSSRALSGLAISFVPAHLLPRSSVYSTDGGAIDMSYRRFTDAAGRVWEAWEVHPSVIERRMNDDRRNRPREITERRHRREFRLIIPPELSAGWLALQGCDAKFRLAPIPDGWIDLPDNELEMLIARAHAAPAPPP
jgi:hypothetical protein